MRDAFAGGNKCVQESYTRVDDRDYINCCGSGCKFNCEDFWAFSKHAGFDIKHCDRAAQFETISLE